MPHGRVKIYTQKRVKKIQGPSFTNKEEGRTVYVKDKTSVFKH